MSAIDLDGVPGLSSPDGLLKRSCDHFTSNMSNEFMGEQKRVKHDDTPPSKVLHIRGLPNFVTESDIITLGIPFGRVTNVLKLPTRRGQKSQAFLEMEDEAKATAMVSYYAYMPASIKGENVYVQYSTHTELKTDPAKQSPLISGLLAAAAAASAGELPSFPTDTSYSATSVTSPQSMGMSNVLRVVVDNMLYPVSIDALHIIFSKYGTVIKIVICTKTNQFQVFVQYPDHVAANAAKSALDGQNIYNGCCTMKIGFSKFSDLNVKYNNDKSRDFSRPDLPSGEGQPAFDPNLGLSALGAAAGFLNNPFLAAGAAAASVPNLGLMGAGNLLQGMGHGNSVLPSQSNERMSGSRGGCPVLLVSQLSPEKIKCDDLFTLFVTMFGRLITEQETVLEADTLMLYLLLQNDVKSTRLITITGAYGDVMRVKILFNKPDTALVQMAESRQAEIARDNLNNVPFQSKHLKVTTSKHHSVSMPKEDSEGAHLTKDYSDSPIHRFRKYGSKNYQNIFPPGRTLHLSNIPSSQTEEDLKLLFTAQTEGTISNFQFFSKDAGKDKKMALLEMSTLEEAVQALVDLHDAPLGENNHLRVSFARKGISR